MFCETGVFEVEDTRRILKAGLEHGLEINFHGDELTHIRASELAGELKALAISHVEKVALFINYRAPSIRNAYHIYRRT